MLRVLGIVVIAVTVNVGGEGRMDMVAVVINSVGGGITGIVIIVSCRMRGRGGCCRLALSLHHVRGGRGALSSHSVGGAAVVA